MPGKKATGLGLGAKVALGVVGVVGVIGGIAYGLAASGIRVPGLYAAVSGLKPDGMGLAAQGSAAVLASSSYDITGQISVGIKAADGSPALPSPSSSDVAVTKVSSLDDQPISAHVADGSWTAQENILVNNQGSATAVTIQARTSDSSAWRAYVPSAGSGASILSLDPTKLARTALFPALALPAPDVIMTDAASAVAYQKKSSGGTSVAQYSYDLDKDKVSSLLPEGATVSAASATMSYAWKTALPVASTLAVSFAYQGDTYAYQASFSYSGWGAGSSLSGQDITALNGSASGTKANPIAFAGELGIASGALPTTLSAAETLTVITPSGRSVTSVSDPVTAVPPIPADTVTTQAKARDAQRLQDLTDLESALKAYKAANGSYPKADTMVQVGSSSALLSALVPTYMTGLPVDPLPSTYWYEYTSSGSTYLLRAVAEDPSNASSKKGVAYHYFERTSN